MQGSLSIWTTWIWPMFPCTYKPLNKKEGCQAVTVNNKSTGIHVAPLDHSIQTEPTSRCPYRRSSNYQINHNEHANHYSTNVVQSFCNQWVIVNAKVGKFSAVSKLF
jgi:hypothetical protein